MTRDRATEVYLALLACFALIAVAALVPLYAVKA